MRYTMPLMLGALAAGIIAPAAAGAQNDVRTSRSESRFYVRGENDGEARAVLGINTGSSGERDTLGLLITSITPGSPAEKAGLEEGNRIAAINGVNLRLSREDAGERDMSGLTSRRLTREMAKLKAGDEVTLRVWKDGAYRDLKVKTIAAEDLRPSSFRVTRESMDERAVLGLSLGSTGSRRDTLGVLVMGLTEGGPAEKAGLVEGDRIQSVGGVDVRVAGEDAGDDWMSSARTQRLRRELAKAKVGEAVELRVWSGGQVKSVRVTPVRAGDLYKEGSRSGTRIFFGDGAMGFGGFAPVPPTPPMPPTMFYGPGEVIVDSEMIRGRVEDAMMRAREAMARAQSAGDRLRFIAPDVRVLPRTQLQAVPRPARPPRAAHVTMI